MRPVAMVTMVMGITRAVIMEEATTAMVAVIMVTAVVTMEMVIPTPITPAKSFRPLTTLLIRLPLTNPEILSATQAIDNTLKSTIKDAIDNSTNDLQETNQTWF